MPRKDERFVTGGITKIDPNRYRVCKGIGYRIKLLAVAKEENEKYEGQGRAFAMILCAPMSNVDASNKCMYIVGDKTGRRSI